MRSDLDKPAAHEQCGYEQLIPELQSAEHVALSQTYQSITLLWQIREGQANAFINVLSNKISAFFMT